jgi:hypothetical protein
MHGFAPVTPFGLLIKASGELEHALLKPVQKRRQSSLREYLEPGSVPIALHYLADLSKKRAAPIPRFPKESPASPRRGFRFSCAIGARSPAMCADVP